MSSTPQLSTITPEKGLTNTPASCRAQPRCGEATVTAAATWGGALNQYGC